MPREITDTGRFDWIIPACLGGLILLPGLAFMLAGGDNRIVAFIPDDAFYYLQTAHHFASDSLISFDGSNPTNGFHPLNFFLVTALASMVGKPLLLPAIVLVTAILLIASVVLIVAQVCLRAEGFTSEISVLALSSPLLLFIWKNLGMESAAVVFSTSMVFVGLIKAGMPESPLRPSPLLGFALSLLMLSRLDLVVPAIVIVLLQFYAAYRVAPSPRSLLTSQSYVAIPLFAGMIYVSWNLILTGHPVPVSGQIKLLGEGSFLFWLKAFSGGLLWKEVLFFVPMIMSAGQLIIAPFLRNRLTKPALRAALFLCIASLSYYGYLIFFGSGFFGWYIAFPISVASLLSILWLDVLFTSSGLTHASRRARGVITASVLLACMLFNFAFFVFQSGRQTNTNDLKDLAGKLDEVVGPEHVIGVFDAGALGYFSTAKVINLDGLANSFEYLSDYLKTNRFLEYFQEQGITHLILRKSMLAEMEDESGGVIFRPDPRVKMDRTSRLFDYRIGSGFEVEVIEFRAYASEPPKQVIELRESGEP